MFFARVHETYLKIAEREPGRVYLVDARRGPDVVHADIVRAVRQRLRCANGCGAPTIEDRRPGRQ
jgi:thymidylate kinase